MPDLATFQRQFAEALTTDEQPAYPFTAYAFAVYRNTTVRAAVEALRAAYPTVDMLLGDEMFTQVAWDFNQETPPASPVLSDYGAAFPAFLARQQWASELPYLADVARIDRLWLDAFLARGVDGDCRPTLGAPTIRLHPAARFGWFETPAMTIWLAHRQPNGEIAEIEPEWVAEGALFTRPGDAVFPQAIDAPCHRLLLTCATPIRLADALSAVTGIFPDANALVLLRACVAAGALIIHGSQERTEPWQR